MFKPGPPGKGTVENVEGFEFVSALLVTVN